MISKNIEKALNKQIAMEAEASFRYLSMATWFEQNGMAGGAEFFYEQSDEERMHMIKLVKYVNEMDGQASIPAISKIGNDYKSVKEIFQLTLQNEKEVTQNINKLVTLADE